MECKLCEKKKTMDGLVFLGHGLFVRLCDRHNKYMAVSIDHKKEFSMWEKSMIKKIFYDDLRLQGTIDWRVCNCQGHAYCYLR